MVIEFKCPNCGETLVTLEDMAGMEGACEGCRHVVIIPPLRAPQEVEPAPLPPPIVHIVVEPPPPKPKPTLTLALLKTMDWKRFEQVVAKLFEMSGYKTSLCSTGADGGVDIRIFKAGQPKPLALVQCKAWNSYTVGVRLIRELFGVMAAEGVPKGYFVTTGDFFAGARDFANGKAITLVDGPAVIERVRKLSDEQQEDLYRLATYGDYQTPSCPACGRKLVRRITKKGRHPGDEFWGCSGFPKCRYRMRMSQGKATGIGNAGKLPSLYGLKATGYEDDDS